MALLDTTQQQQYYEGNNHGNYQFTSLKDVINQFIIGYVGENKIISKIKRNDVAFFAQRALQELSFDTFKSCKMQEIVLPPTLVMPLPIDYVNYVKLSWSDAGGVEHVIYPTSKSSNPTKIKQDDDGNYQFSSTGFTSGSEMVINGDWTNPNSISAPWYKSGVQFDTYDARVNLVTSPTGTGNAIRFTQPTSGAGETEAFAVWQPIDVSNKNTVKLSSNKTSSSNATTTVLGISTIPGSTDTSELGPNTALPDLGHVSWGANEGGQKDIIINVVDQTTVYVLIQSYATSPNANPNNAAIDIINTVSVTSTEAITKILTEDSSTTWNSYKSNTPSENNINDYQDYQNDIFWPNEGRRFGLDPQHAQVNGSYFIDCKSGKIHFSSNLSGKTVILEYISDSLGTDSETKVHKLAEEAIYKWIAYGILSTRANTPEYIVQRFKKEKFAETRKAKLRLSNIKLEEITQILRGKSKLIKH